MNSRIALYFSVVLPGLFAFMAIFFFVISLRTLFRRRPFIFSSRWFFVFLMVAFAPTMLHPLVLLISGREPNPISLISPIIFVVLTVFFWKQMGGYISIAAGDTYFRESLLSAITSLGYTPVEMISRIRIKETTEEFQIAVQGWIGTAQLKPVSKYSAPTLKKIVRNMNRYFRNSRGKMNYTLSYFYLIFGFLMLFLCLALLSMDLSVAADK